jgi:hypothetical protein
MVTQTDPMTVPGFSPPDPSHNIIERRLNGFSACRGFSESLCMEPIVLSFCKICDKGGRCMRAGVCVCVCVGALVWVREFSSSVGSAIKAWVLFRVLSDQRLE